MEHIMNLDLCVLQALQHLSDPENPVPGFTPATAGLTLVAGSGNALLTGRYLYRNAPAIYANQDDYQLVWKRFEGCLPVERLTIVSASGGRDAVKIAQFFEDKVPNRLLLTNNPEAEAASHVAETVVFPSMPGEPHTYNVSTYMSLLLGASAENPAGIFRLLHEELELPRDIGDYPAYYFLVPPEYEPIAEMFNIKFREIFGSHVYGRASTEAHSNHGLFVNRSTDELVVGLGVDNNWRGYRRWNLAIPDMGPATLMAVGYYLIGQIQRRKQPWFRENLRDYIDTIAMALGWKVRLFT